MVTGEAVGFESAAAQPGGRPPAPGDLALVQAFVNSHYDLEVEHGADLFATPSELGRWLSARGLLAASARLRARELSRALAVREGLRRLAAANNHAGRSVTAARLQRLNQAAASARVEIRLEPAGPRFVATGVGLDRALAQVLAITATAMLDGTWRRLKVCPGDHCGWAFYDHSRNQTGRWCSMSVCGGRAKARTHYHRHRNEDSG